MGTAVKTVQKKRGRIPAALKSYFAIWVNGKIDLADTVFDPKIVRHQPASIHPPEVVGIEAYKAYVTEFRNMHPDLKFEILDVVESERAIAYRYEASALNTVTNQRFTFFGIGISKFTRGKIVEEFITWDTYDLMSQVGLVPPREALQSTTWETRK